MSSVLLVAHCDYSAFATLCCRSAEHDVAKDQFLRFAIYTRQQTILMQDSSSCDTFLSSRFDLKIFPSKRFTSFFIIAVPIVVVKAFVIARLHI